MAIYKKTVIDEYIREVEDDYRKVRTALGRSDIDWLMYRIDQFRITVKHILQLKGKQEKPLHRP